MNSYYELNLKEGQYVKVYYIGFHTTFNCYGKVVDVDHELESLTIETLNKDCLFFRFHDKNFEVVNEFDMLKIINQKVMKKRGYR